MYAIAIHGGAGELTRRQAGANRAQAYHRSLAHALAAGETLLAQGASALDAVQAAVTALEDDPLFNAGRGAVLCDDGASSWMPPS
jgi:beta-aspartyl-peptidase (threonine type)